MLDVSRRELIVSAAGCGAGRAFPPMALGQTAGGGPPGTLPTSIRATRHGRASGKSMLNALRSSRRRRERLAEAQRRMRAALSPSPNERAASARLYSYARLKADEDRRVGANQERKQQANDVFTAIGEATAWTNPEVVALGAPRRSCLHCRRPGAKNAFRVRTALHAAFRAAHLVADGEQLLAAAVTPLAGPQDIREQLASPIFRGRR